MTAPLRLVVFDVDGTLVDSQADIVASMAAAFASVGARPPSRAAILSIVGLSLPQAIAQLAPDRNTQDHAQMVDAYKDAYVAQRAAKGAVVSSPLYPGVANLLDRLAHIDSVVLGVATGKSRRGLDALLDSHGLRGTFVTEQVSDHHPSKPHPAMLEAALRDAGVAPQDAVMIGDTSYDMDMAAAAQVPGIGVCWGYHDADQLGAAQYLVDRAEDIATVLSEHWSMRL